MKGSHKERPLSLWRTCFVQNGEQPILEVASDCLPYRFLNTGIFVEFNAWTTTQSKRFSGYVLSFADKNVIIVKGRIRQTFKVIFLAVKINIQFFDSARNLTGYIGKKIFQIIATEMKSSAMLCTTKVSRIAL